MFIILSIKGVVGPLPLWLHYFTAYGPMLSAIIVVKLSRGGEGIRSLLRGTIKWNVGVGWILIAFSPVALFAFGVIITYLFARQIPNLSLLGKINFLPNLGILAFPIWILTSGIGEETGWRGFALPRLQKNMGALGAAVVVGLFWALWHVPAFFYLPNYMKMGLASFPGLAFGIIAGSILLTWLYNSTRGSILMAILWHGAFNFVTASKAGEGTAAMITSILVMVWAILIVLILGPRNLSALEKQQI